MCVLHRKLVHCDGTALHLDQNDDLNRANNERFCRVRSKELGWECVWWWSSLRNPRSLSRKKRENKKLSSAGPEELRSELSWEDWAKSKFASFPVEISAEMPERRGRRGRLASFLGPGAPWPTYSDRQQSYNASSPEFSSLACGACAQSATRIWSTQYWVVLKCRAKH